MYYVNRQQIEQRLRFIPLINRALERLQDRWDDTDDLHALALERAVHLSIESVTDIGSFMIDGFLMRDASSYEDIIEILRGENVFPDELAEPLIELVKLRKPLVQEYYALERSRLQPFLLRLPQVLARFAESVQAYLKRELGEV